MWGPSAMLGGVILSGCDWHITVLLLCAAMYLNGAVTASIMVNHTDIAPNFAGEFANLLRRIY